MLRAGRRHFTNFVLEDTGMYWPRGRVEDLLFQDCRLHHLTIGAFPFTGCLFKRCDFRRVDLNGFSARRTSFRDCTFQDVNFGDRIGSAFVKCRLVRCGFTSCVWTTVNVYDSEISDCVLNLHATDAPDWRNCRFSSVKFGGELGNMGFFSNKYNGLDLTQVSASELRWGDGLANGVVFPCRPDTFAAESSEFEKAEHALIDLVLAQDKPLLIDSLNHLASLSGVVIVNENIFLDLSEPSRKYVLAYLYERRIRQ
jgi:hypothetical protein